jgi:flagellar hook assembly protein FlgD
MKEQATIHYSLKEGSPVTINIYTMQGVLIQTLANGSEEVGNHSINWQEDHVNDLSLPAGIYFIEFKTDIARVVKKLMKLF